MLIIPTNLQYIGHCTECSSPCYLTSNYNQISIHETCGCNAKLDRGHPLFHPSFWGLRLLVMGFFSMLYYFTGMIGILTPPLVLFLVQIGWYYSDKNPNMDAYDIKRTTNFETNHEPVAI